MKSRLTLFVILLLTLLSLSALAAQEMPTEEPTPEATLDLAALPAWMTTELTDARTGETFILADFAGQVVSVEPMATWCTVCLGQQRQVIGAYDALGALPEDAPEDAEPAVIFISLSVAENISDERLAAYADREGFEWIFAVVPPIMLDGLVTEFGRAVITPPSSPHFYILPDGAVTELTTGFQSSADLIAEITDLLPVMDDMATPEAGA